MTYVLPESQLTPWEWRFLAKKRTEDTLKEITNFGGEELAILGLRGAIQALEASRMLSPPMLRSETK